MKKIFSILLLIIVAFNSKAQLNYSDYKVATVPPTSTTISFTPTATIQANTVQGAVTEVEAEKSKFIVTTPPIVTAVDELQLFIKRIGRYEMSGVDFHNDEYTLQRNLFYTNCNYWLPSTGVGISSIGATSVTSGAITNPTPVAGSYLNQLAKFQIASAATVGSIIFIRPAKLEFYGGELFGTNNLGGYTVSFKFATPAIVVGERAFVGISSSIANPTNVDPTAISTESKIGMATIGSDWFLIHSNGGATAPTQVPLTGGAFGLNQNNVYQLTLYTPPNSDNTYYYVKNLLNNVTQTGIINTNKPAKTTFLARRAWATNNTAATAVTLAFGAVLKESN